MENKKKVVAQRKNKAQQVKLKNLTNFKPFFIIFFLLLLLVIFCIYKVVIFIQNPTDIFSVEQGKIYQEERAIGYIMREETLVKGSNYKNGMEQIKSEGERVAKKEAIFRYYTNGENNLIKKIQDLDKKIDEAMSDEEQLPNSDIKALEKQIETQINSLYQENNLQNIKEIKQEISSNITKKAKIAGELSPSGSYLKKLINERSKYENELNEGAEYLKAPISGVVSYKVDGYEEILAPTDFSKINTEFLEGLNLKTGQVIVDSKEEAKIINNFECYIACSLNSTQAEQAEVGDTVKLRLPNDTEVTSEIVYRSQEEDNVLLVFQIDKQVQNLTSYRKISFDIIWWSDSGKKVPNDAIGTEVIGEKTLNYVIRIRADYQDKIWIKVLRNNDKYSIVENYTRQEIEELGFSAEESKKIKTLTLYDEILKKPT